MSLFVYSGVVDSHFVENLRSLLRLRTAPIRSSRFVTDPIDFANIQYLTVAYTNSEVLKIHECRDNSETIYFNGGKMIVNLNCNNI